MKNFVVGIDHVQLSMHAEDRDKICSFYREILHMTEVYNPGSHGGVWFESQGVCIHFGIDPSFIPSQRSHIALAINDMTYLVNHCKKFSIEMDERINEDGSKRVYIKDPCGNRIELLGALL